MAASLDGVALHSDLAQSNGVRKQRLPRALGSRDESEQFLTVALGGFNLTLPGDCRLDMEDGGRD